MSADLALFKLGTIEMTGADWDPVAALVFCGPPKAATVIVNGRVVVRDGQMLTIDLPREIERHRRLSRALMNGEPAA
jgi:8-oxoguanine deaminase